MTGSPSQQSKVETTRSAPDSAPPQRRWLRHELLDRSPLVRDLVARGRDWNAYQRWMEQVARTGYCCNPVRISGRVIERDLESGDAAEVYTTDGEPDRCVYLACGNRRESRCQACSTIYRGDAFQLVASGLRGGKGVPEIVSQHPMVFVTLTAPGGFGPVHSRRERLGEVQACHPARRGRGNVCPHGVRLCCYRKHKKGEEVLGQPLCTECFDYKGAVLWNALASALWKRTPTRILREVASLTGHTVREVEKLVRVSFVKTGETQTRGAIHFHAIVRLDAAPPPTRRELVLRPAEGFTTDVLADAVRAAVPKVVAQGPVEPDGTRFEACWGRQVDVQQILGANSELSAEAMAGYVAKYATKEPEWFVALNRRISCEGDIEVLGLNEHLRRLVATAWRLGAETHLRELNLRLWAHQLGFRGHWLTKSRRYSTTFKSLQEERAAWQREKRYGARDVDAWGRPTDSSRERVGSWLFVGAGYRTHADSRLAETAWRSACEGKQALKEERARLAMQGI